MKSVIASGLLALGMLLSLDKCGTPSNKPSTVDGLKTTAGDGVWIVGEEIAAGLWQPVDDWQKLPKCAWFVAPASKQPSATRTTVPTSRRAKAETPSGLLTVRLHNGETFTTYQCHTWIRTGD
jgi:hypothetical protein